MSNPIRQNGKENYENSESIILENSKNQKHRLTISNNLQYIQFIIEDLLSVNKKRLYFINNIGGSSKNK